MLEIGKKAPAFTGTDDKGEKVTLKDFASKKIVLYFYPKDMTPGCTTEAQDFQANLTKIKRNGAVVIGVSKDSVDRHTRFKDKYDLKFPLISDEEGKLCEKYGVWQKKKLYGKEFMGIVRSTFLIGENGKLLKVWPKVKVKGHVDEVIEAIKEYK